KQLARLSVSPYLNVDFAGERVCGAQKTTDQVVENGDAFANHRPFAALPGNVRLRAGDPPLLGFDEFLPFSPQLSPRHLVCSARPKGPAGALDAEPGGLRAPNGPIGPH